MSDSFRNSVKRLVANECKFFRINVLHLSLTDMADITGINIKTLSAYEHGKSSNLSIMLQYFKLANDEQKKLLAENIFNIL